jgi:hypothetical protein
MIEIGIIGGLENVSSVGELFQNLLEIRVLWNF